MNGFMTKLVMGLMFLFPLAVFAEKDGKAQMIQVLIEKDSKGKAQSMVINSKGMKTQLTLGSFINAIADAAIMGGTQSSPPTSPDPNTVAYLKVVQDSQGTKTYLVGVKNQNDPTGRLEPLTLGNLISASAVAYPGCTADQING